MTNIKYKFHLNTSIGFRAIYESLGQFLRRTLTTFFLEYEVFANTNYTGCFKLHYQDNEEVYRAKKGLTPAKISPGINRYTG